LGKPLSKTATFAEHAFKMRGQCLKIQQGFVNIENKQRNGHDDSSVEILTYALTLNDKHADRITTIVSKDLLRRGRRGAHQGGFDATGSSRALPAAQVGRGTILCRPDHLLAMAPKAPPQPRLLWLPLGAARAQPAPSS
jgi:hypothetical protein